jgi:hypothetical protein
MQNATKENIGKELKILKLMHEEEEQPSRHEIQLQKEAAAKFREKIKSRS